MQNGKQQVLFIYFSCSLDTCLQHGKFQNVTGFLVQHEVCRVDRYTNLILSHALLQFCLDGLQIQVQTVKQPVFPILLAKIDSSYNTNLFLSLCKYTNNFANTMPK